jgi:hypothetical protein
MQSVKMQKKMGQNAKRQNAKKKVKNAKRQNAKKRWAKMQSVKNTFFKQHCEGRNN